MDPQKRPYLPVDPLTARQIARCSCPSTLSLPLPVDPLAAFARHITRSLCLSTPSLPVNTLSVHQNARCSCPSTLSLPLPVRPLIVCARQPNPCICPSTQSLYLPVDSLTVSARPPTRSKMPNEVARQLIYCLCLTLPVDPLL
ncbi:hypothetical protein OUZ56_029844 [Daphnia magna]|uniref:Uncharacterized protein n=1 Tax=Daphnia magna TaxID=35525 RepID=A0ABR0B810_9CRUS|nr:hypothetical protein OUZ56_029844 [Daphnia magna]